MGNPFQKDIDCHEYFFGAHHHRGAYYADC